MLFQGTRQRTSPATPVGSAILGGFIWLVTLMWPFLGHAGMGLIEQLFLLAPLVIVPLALPLLESPDLPPSGRRLYWLIQLSQPFGALAAAISFLISPGLVAAGLAASWLLVTGLIALFGLVRLLGRGLNVDIAEISIDLGCLYLPVGGGWLVWSRLGANPLGFGEVIVLLTAVHFHYAGFAAPLITGMAGRALRVAGPGQSALYRAAAVGVSAGTPLVAAGVTLASWLELAGAIILATSLILLAYLTVFTILPAISHRPARFLLVVSAGSALVAMLFTYAFAIGQFSGIYLVTIPQMARFHGLANALGFALCGLLGWHMLHRPALVRQRVDEA